MEDFKSNKHLPRLFAQALNEKRIELFDEFIHTEYNNHNPQVQLGPTGVKTFFRHYLDAFPDTKVVMEDVIEDGDRISARFTYRGTFTNPFMGYQPNAAPDVDAPHLHRCGVGLVAHEWIRKGSPVSEAGADAVTVLYHVLHHNFGIGKCAQVVPKERLNSSWSRLDLWVVIVVLRVNELIEKFDPFLVQCLREQLWEMFVAHESPPCP